MPRLPIALLSLVLVSSLGAVDRRPLTLDDSLDLTQVSGGVLSPDGARVFFAKSELDWAKNERKRTYWMVPADGAPKDAFEWLGDDGGSSFAFSPDGAWFTMLRPQGEKEKKSQLFAMRSSGGEARPWTSHESSISSYRWCADGSRIVFLCERPKSEEEKKKHDKDDAVFVDEGPHGQSAARWHQLWSFDPETRETRLLLDDDVRVGGYDVAPDGSRVVYSARAENRRNQGNLSELWVLSVEDGVKRRLTENRAPESGPLFAPDGVHVLFSAPDDSQWELRNSKLWLMNSDTRATRLLSGAFDGTVRGAVFGATGDEVLFIGLQRTESNLYRLDVGSGEVWRLTDRGGSMGSASWSRDRSRLLYSYSDHDSPSDLFVADVMDFRPRRVTDGNPGFEERFLLAERRVIRWKSFDGLEIEGILDLPPTYREGTRVPLMLNIHGGPAGVFTNSFRASDHVWAGLGWASLRPNVRGSSGYSDDLLRGNMRDIGRGDYHDLMTGVDKVIADGVADPDRMGVRGWSYGGILGGVTITKTARFKAASIGAGVYDWTSEYGPGFNYDIRRWYIGGTPWESPEEYRDKSALTHVTNVATPTILFHGMRDTTDTEAQSMMFFSALKDIGRVPVRYVKFPREGHGIREPRHRRTLDVEEISWMHRHVLGAEWEPAEREEPAKPTKKESGS